LDVRAGLRGPGTLWRVKMNPLWIWVQGIIVVGTLAGMVIAITKLT
jgi:hypothetical protein